MATTRKQHVQSNFELKAWDEETYADDPRLVRATVSKLYSGDVLAVSTSEYVMAYADDGTATFVGLEHITGTIGDRAGTLVLQHVGTYADGVARASVMADPAASTDDLAGVQVTGSFAATSGPNGTVELDLTF